MTTIIISKKQYKKLLDKELRLEYFLRVLKDDIFSPPPTKNVGEVVGAFKATKKYNRQFIKGLEKGLKRSSHFAK